MLQIDKLPKQDTRSGFGQAMLELGANPKVMALTADLTGSVKLNEFDKKYPKRFVQCGIAEANMIGVATGLAIAGFIPFASTFAAFATGRVYDQIRQSVAYSNSNVKIAASHAGLTVGEDGATHQMLEDIALMRLLPNMMVVVPCDYEQTRQATLALADHHGPAYLRFGRPKVPTITTPDDEFVLGHAQVLRPGKAATIIACGHLVVPALQAADTLSQEGLEVSVINMHTIKPLDQEVIVEAAKWTGAIVTAEEHMANGGLGEAVAHVLALELPCVQEMVAVHDRFGQSGKPEQLMELYGLTPKGIYEAVKRAIARKQKA